MSLYLISHVSSSTVAKLTENFTFLGVTNKGRGQEADGRREKNFSHGSSSPRLKERSLGS
jgi:hypothetical protein